MSPETRKFLASGFLVTVLIALVGYLTFIPVPDTNKDLIITILGVLVGAGSAAIPNLVGDPKAETQELRERLDTLTAEFKAVEAKYNEVKRAYDEITAMLVQRHVVTGEGNASHA
jgi:hypothetical protein